MASMENDFAGHPHAVRGGALAAMAESAGRGLRLKRATFTDEQVEFIEWGGSVRQFHVLAREEMQVWASAHEDPTVSQLVRDEHSADLYDLGSYAEYLRGRCGDAIYTALDFAEERITVRISSLRRHYVFTIPTGQRDSIWPDAFQDRICAHPDLLEHQFTA